MSKKEDPLIVAIRYLKEKSISNNPNRIDGINEKAFRDYMIAKCGKDVKSGYYMDLAIKKHGLYSGMKLSLEAYAYLLEHDELLEARKSAKIAQWSSFIAISISILTASISIYFSFQPVKLSQEQIKTLVDSNQVKMQDVRIEDSQVKEILKSIKSRAPRKK